MEFETLRNTVIVETEKTELKLISRFYIVLAFFVARPHNL